MSQSIPIIDDSTSIHKLIGVFPEYLRPGFILLDGDMPGMNSLEVCRHLKANMDTAGIPFLFTTGQAQFATIDSKTN